VTPATSAIKLMANSLSPSRVTAPLLELGNKHADALTCVRTMFKTGIFAQFCKPFAKYTALHQLLIGV